MTTDRNTYMKEYMRQYRAAKREVNVNTDDSDDSDNESQSHQDSSFPFLTVGFIIIITVVLFINRNRVVNE